MRNVIVCIIILAASLVAGAQPEIGYAYDLRGNRILKKPTPLKRGNENQVLEEFKGVTLYPNPASSEINLDFGYVADTAVLYLSIFDGAGREASGERMIYGIGVQTFPINRLSPGQYFVRLLSEDEDRQTLISFIVQ